MKRETTITLWMTVWNGLMYSPMLIREPDPPTWTTGTKPPEPGERKEGENK